MSESNTKSPQAARIEKIKKGQLPIKFEVDGTTFIVKVSCFGDSLLPSTVIEYWTGKYEHEQKPGFLFLSSDCDERIRLIECLAFERKDAQRAIAAYHRIREAGALPYSDIVILGYNHRTHQAELRVDFLG